MKYQFIDAQRACYPVRMLCAVLHVSVSGYYAWRQRPPCQQRHAVDQQLSQQVDRVFRQSRQTYGSPRVYAALKAEGVPCSRRRVARVMHAAGWISCWRRTKRHVYTTDSQHTDPVVPNRLQRDFTAAGPNQKWVGDITGIWTAEGWLYLAALVDVYSRRVVGWAMGAERDARLVEVAFEMAVHHRQPASGLLHHTDRGSQYTSGTYQAVLAQYEMEVSMSRKGNCWDNALMESFFGTLKVECVDRYRFGTRQQAKTTIFEYIEIFYNRQRRHSALGYRIPVAFEHAGYD